MADEDRGGNSLLAALAHPQIVNPLAAYSDAARTANSIWANREMQAKQAAGEAQRGAIDPTTGVYDPNQAGRLLSQAGPGAALAAGPTLESNQRLSDQQLAQAQKKIGWVNAASGAALQSGDYSDSAMLKLFQDGMAGGMLTLPEVQKQLSTLPPDAAGRQRWLQQHQMTAASTQQQLDQTYGTRQEVHAGGDIQFPVVPPASAGGPVPTVPITRTPGERMTTQPTVAEDGTPGTVPNDTRYDERGHLKPPGWGNSGKYPAPGAGGAPAAPTAPPGFTPTGQAPGAAESQRQEAEASTAAGTKIYKDADAATTMKSQLLTMESDLAKISTGPTSERAAMVNAFLQKYGLPSTMSAEEIASSEGFAKIAKQIALAQAGALGAGTDEKLTTSMGANPNRDLSKLGNQQILAMLQGNADAIKARGVAYEEWKKTNPGGKTNSFLTDFNKTFDPRVYQWGYQIRNMTPDQRTAAFNALPDKEAFRRKYNAAVAQHLIDPYAY